MRSWRTSRTKAPAKDRCIEGITLSVGSCYEMTSLAGTRAGDPTQKGGGPMMRSSQWLMLVVLMLFTGGVCAGDATVDVGPWTATAGDADLKGLSWQGEMILQRGSLRGYTPGWQGGRFPDGDWERQVDEDSVIWTRNEADNQDATVRLTPGNDVARYELESTIYAQGPTEFSVQIAPEAVLEDGRCLLWADGNIHTLATGEPLETIDGVQELRLQAAERTVIVRSSRFQLQDRRDRGSGLFLVSVIGHRTDEPREVERWVEVEVQPAAAEDIPARRRLVQQVPTEISDVTLENAGFEADEPFDGWSGSPLASVDTEVAHGGKQSARLDIEGEVEERHHVYITRSVPVTPGHRYRAEAWIRGEGIEALEQGGMSSVGATIIVEFARPDGSWFAAGSYGDSHFETFDWDRAQTDIVTAPEGAGYAIIYLALRGTGTAWFDDVGLEEVRHFPVLLDPMDGARVHDNTPQLTWHFPQDAQATVELSQDAQFAEDATVSVEEVRSPLRIEEPIEPGQWHWRVTVPGYDGASGVWSFQQTAGLDEDTTEPEIARTHDWLATPKAPMRIEYSDNVGVATVRMTVDEEDVSERVEMGEESATYRPEEPWSDGLHVAEVQVEDAAGNVAEATIFFTAGRPEHRITWEERGGVSVDGEKRFLLGMYGVNEDDMPQIAQAGYDFCHSYSWDGSGDTESALAYLDEAQRHGLQAFMGLSRARLQAHDERFVAERIAALMRHPGLFAWYLYDEPDLEHQYVSPEWLERYYRLIKALDPFHPVIVTVAQIGKLGEYRDALDVHWAMVYRDTAFVAQRMERQREILREGTPLAAILHCYDRSQSGLAQAGGTPDPAEFEPTGRMMRANAFMAIAHNSSGLSWWWWGYGGSNRFYTVANAPEAWGSLQETVADIQELEPVLTAEGEIATRVLEAAEDVEVHVWEKRLADRVVTIAVNSGDEAVDAGWTPEWGPEDGTADVLWEEREVALEGDAMRDTFEPRDVHVYVW